jgi:glutathione S-transferase
MAQFTLTAFQWVPPFAQGLVRDLRVRWALEETGFPYTVKLIGAEELEAPAYRKKQPFGQVPVLEEGDFHMYESGAIVMHLAEKSEILMPKDAHAKARTQTWMFAALNTIEPHISNLGQIDLFSAKEEWAKLRRPAVLETLRKRLGELARWMEGREYLEDRFTAGDLLMASVLRVPRQTEVVKEFPALASYLQRCEKRPAFQKALADQMAAFAKHEPKKQS